MGFSLEVDTETEIHSTTSSGMETVRMSINADQHKKTCLSITSITTSTAAATLSLLLLALVSFPFDCTAQEYRNHRQLQGRFPADITLRAAIFHAPPFATVEEQEDGSLRYGGFCYDMLQSLQEFAAADNVTLTFNTSKALDEYNPALDLVANDCGICHKPRTLR